MLSLTIIDDSLTMWLNRYHAVKTVTVKALANLANLANYSNLPGLFTDFHNFHSIACICLLLINARKASWFTVTYALIYTYMVPYYLLFMATISSIVIVQSYLHFLQYCHYTTGFLYNYNELTITSKPLAVTHHHNFTFPWLSDY